MRLTAAAFDVPDFSPRYNVAPTQQVLSIRSRDGARSLSLLRWGLIPSWGDSSAIGGKMINARADTVATKPAFRSAFKKSRLPIAADGFYEWQVVGKAKQPYFIRFKDDRPFAFAGLAEHWSKAGETIDCCTIIPGINIPEQPIDARREPQRSTVELEPIALVVKFAVQRSALAAMKCIGRCWSGGVMLAIMTAPNGWRQALIARSTARCDRLIERRWMS